MICPHCKRELIVKVAVRRGESKRHAYWQKRHIESGKAKVRTSLDQLGKCMRCGCEVEGRNECCETCKRELRRKRENEYYHLAKDKENAG